MGADHRSVINRSNERRERKMMKKLMVLVATIMLVGVAFTAQAQTTDRCYPWAGKDPLPASAFDPCIEAGFIAGQVADLRDKHISKDAATMDLFQFEQSLQGLSLKEIDRTYVTPVYDSKESWHSICVEYTNACRSR
jgi:hypothetical protein